MRGWRLVRPLALRTRLKTLAADGLEDPLPVLGAVRLENQLDRGLANVELNPLADVLDVDYVRPLLGDDSQQRRECARAIRNLSLIHI